MQVIGVSLPRANKRLIELYNQVLAVGECEDIVTDVGADHGYLAAMIAKSNIFKKVIATDISAPSLQKASELANQLNIKLETRVGDGLVVAPETTLACICGMGGYEIIKILQNQNTTKKYVLQPVQNPIELRKFLLKNHYKLVADYVIEDKSKFYYIITINGKGFNKYNRVQKLFGKQNFKNLSKDFKMYLKNQINKLKFLDNFDIKSIEHKQRKEIRRKQRYYKLCKKILKQEV